VDLSSDQRLQRALEEWQPHFLAWWREMGPERFQEDAIYLRTAVSVDAGGWAHFDYVRMPEYRWGIFLAEPVPERRIGFGNDFGKPVWQEVPGEHRNTLRRLIVTQGDTEPASVEQQRRLGASCPSLYDLRNLFQVNVEEGRHLWAMAYLLHTYFGRDGREEARALRGRTRPGDHPEVPELLVLALARPLRQRGLDQRGAVLRGGVEGPAAGGGALPGPPGTRGQLRDGRLRGRAARPEADRAPLGD